MAVLFLETILFSLIGKHCSGLFSSSLYNNSHSKGNMTGILFALTAALFWGSGDFSGGFATRKANPFQVLALSAIAGVVILATAALVAYETMPPAMGILWSLLAGLSGAIGITSLYTALSRGNAAAVAPISAVLGAAIPVGFTFLLRGSPAVLQVVGFGLAFIGIWLVSRSAPVEGKKTNSPLGLAFLAGAGFGGYFIFIGQVESSGVFIPLLIARGVMFLSALLILAFKRLPLPSFRGNPIAPLAGVLDAAGNVFFLLAISYSRLDFAVVISSLYPAVTVLLAAFLLKEKVGMWQKAGVVLCLAAILLISL
jgi:drug/metabolite transporter (DMT)-like permease